MPIQPAVLQRGLYEVGRIRIGEKKATTTRDGRATTRPAKLGTFRFTARNEETIAKAARLLGGAPERWTDAPSDDDQWQVTTAAAAIDVIVPPADMAFTQFLETWSAGGCQRRCDGITELRRNVPCLCDPEQRECDFHTRLSVLLMDLPGLGLWRLESKGYYAARELAGAIDICRWASPTGMVPARLRLEQRQVKREVNGKTTTLKFVVPVLDPGAGRSLRDLVESGRPVLDLVDPATGEITAGSGNGWEPVAVEALPSGPQPSVVEQVTAVNDPPPPSQRANAQQPMPGTGLKPRPASAVPHEIEGAAGDSLLDPAAPSEPQTPTERGNDQLIAIAAREAGLDDGGRHAFLHAFSGGRYASAKDVPTSEVNDVRAELVRVKRGESSVWPSQPTLEPAPAVIDVPLPEPATFEDTETHDQVWWLAKVADVEGVGQAKLLKAARELAGELGVTPPNTLNAVPAEINDRLEAWIGEQG